MIQKGGLEFIQLYPRFSKQILYANGLKIIAERCFSVSNTTSRMVLVYTVYFKCRLGDYDGANFFPFSMYSWVA